MKFRVTEIPPYKQAPANGSERDNQKLRSEALRIEARKAFQALITQQNVRLTIRYFRKKGRSDASNIAGGITDALNGIAYNDDKQITEIHYQEMKGSIDEYQVLVEPI
jgi:Holliday junction resolvase RusA-like endonuclease